MIFFPAALLQSDAPLTAYQENRKSPVEQSRRVHRVFLTVADRTVLLINEDELFGHGSESGDVI